MCRRRRPGDWPATRQPSPCVTVQAGKSWTSAAGPAPSRPLYAGRWRPATGSAGSRAARTAAAMRITYGTGPTAVGPRSTIWCSCAAAITGRCMRKGSASHSTRRVTCGSCDRTAAPSPRPRRLRTGPARRSHQWQHGSIRTTFRLVPTPPRPLGGANGSTSAGLSACCGGRGRKRRRPDGCRRGRSCKGRGFGLHSGGPDRSS